jgi:hypothetical protein
VAGVKKVVSLTGQDEGRALLTETVSWKSVFRFDNYRELTPNPKTSQNFSLIVFFCKRSRNRWFKNCIIFGFS